jgi:WXXGXW repeat (2 copies)
MDFLVHLVDAPLANILIIAGLLFLGIGAVGKVTGKIEPDKMGRMMASLLGVVLLVAGVLTHVRGDKNQNLGADSSLQPVVRAFSITPPQVAKGGTITISWNVLNADDVELEPFGQVPATGDRTVQPEQTTIYRLNATNKNGGKSGTFQEVIVSDTNPRARGETSSPTPSQSSANIPSGSNKDSAAQEQQDSQDEQSVYATQAPPLLPIENSRPFAPDGNYRWTPGCWYYDRDQSDFYWVPAAWVTPPNGEVWTPPYWEYDKGRYRLHYGYWGPHRGFYGGIDYGFGYSSSGYQRSDNKSGNRVSYNGGPGGIQQKPTTKELAAKQDKHNKPLEVQGQRARSARNDRKQFFLMNHGRPPMLSIR